MSAARSLSKVPAAALLTAALALLVRLAFLVAFARSQLADFYVADQTYYRDWAMRLAAGEPSVRGAFEQGPLYAWLLAAVYRVVGPHDAVVLLLQLGCGVGTVLLVRACALRLFGARAALAAGLLAALCGPLVFHEGLVMKSFLEPLLAVLALHAALRHAEDGRARRLAAAGAAVGLLCLVREVHVLLLVPLLAWGWVVGRRRCEPPTRRIAPLALTAVCCALAILPATLLNCLVGGECAAVTTGGGEVAYIALGPYASAYYTPPHFVRTESRLEHEDFRDEARLRTGRPLSRGAASAHWLREALRAAAASPGRTAGLAGARVRALLNDYEFPDSENYAVTRAVVAPLAWLPSFGWIAGLGLLGAALAWRRRGDALLPLAFGGVLVLEVVLTYAFGRFRLVLEPLLLIFAGHAAAWLTLPAASGGPGRLPRAAAASAALLLTGLAFAPPPVSGGRAWIAKTNGDFTSELAIRSQQRRVAAELERSLRARPGDAGAWEVLGGELEATGRLHEAVQAHERAVRVEPGRASSHWALARLRYKEGRLDRAAEEARTVVRLQPGNAEAHLALAVFCSRIGVDAGDPGTARQMRQEAAGHFAELERLDPRNPLGWYYRGKFAALEGRAAEAAGLLARALDLDPGLAEARHVLALLRP